MKHQNLGAREDLRTFLYHMDGILEIQDELRISLMKLDSSLGRDPDASGKVLGQMEADIFFRLAYHMQMLREPFEKVLTEVYGVETHIAVDQKDE